jgi:DNA-directed RNA polymerase subunit M/transcription elongation factor TFIIS
VSVKNPTVLRKHFQYRHSGEKVDETRKCDKCDVVSKNYIAHRKHQAIDHGVGKLYTCEMCGQQNVQRLKHLRHIREVHERKR